LPLQAAAAKRRIAVKRVEIFSLQNEERQGRAGFHPSERIWMVIGYPPALMSFEYRVTTTISFHLGHPEKWTAS
jgi:hypothetical protein